MRAGAETSMARKSGSGIDWDKAEKLYRAGMLSDAEIGRQVGCTRQAVQKHAAKHGWKRDLSERVRQEIKTRLVAQEVAATARAQPATEAAIVDEAAKVGVELVRQHRADIKKGRGIANLLLIQLESAIRLRPEVEEAIEDNAREEMADAAGTSGHVARDDYQRIQARKRQMLQAVSLPAHASVMRDLSHALKNVIGLEREAYGLTDGDGKPPSDVPAVSYDVSFGV